MKLTRIFSGLAPALAIAGFEPVALRFCDRDGIYHDIDPRSCDAYRSCVDDEFVYSLDYLNRPESLVVDGVRRSRLR